MPDRMRTLFHVRFEQREEDGAIFVSSQDLPLFHIYGDDMRHACGVLSAILPEYLERNAKPEARRASLKVVKS